MKRLLLALIPALLVLASAGGVVAQDSYGSTTATTVTVKKDAKLGNILADSKGMTLYLFTNDTKKGASACTGKCATTWPPFTVTDASNLTLPSGVSGALTTFKRADGTEQVAYNDIPLYHFAKDEDSGDAYGQGIGGIWFTVKPGTTFGATKPIIPTVMTKKDAKLGTILADSKGMTLYMFTKDTKENATACTGGCATSWPPLLLAKGAKLNLATGLTGKLTTFKLADGTEQVAYNGIPLYHFAKDGDSGDAYGQGVGGIWFVVDPGQKFGAAPMSAASPTASPAAAPAATAAAAPASSASAIEIKGFAFGPASMTVAVGTTITWTNDDSTAHTVTSDTGAFDSGTVNPGQTFSFTFTKAGSFAYHCNFHANMHGTVIVQ